MVFSRMDKWELTKPDPYLYLQLFAITANTFPLGMCLCSRFLEVELLGHLKYWDKLTSRKTLPISSPTSVFKNSHFSTSLQRIDISKRLKSFPTRMSTKWSFSLSSLSPYSSYFSFSFHMCSWCLDPPNKAWHPRCAYHKTPFYLWFLFCPGEIDSKSDSTQNGGKYVLGKLPGWIWLLVITLHELLQQQLFRDQ